MNKNIDSIRTTNSSFEIIKIVNKDTYSFTFLFVE
jgi:hypothetical protein